MPENYIICKINGNVFINIFSMISRIICCCLILFSEFEITYKYVIYITMTSLCFICFLLYMIFFKEILLPSHCKKPSLDPAGRKATGGARRALVRGLTCDRGRKPVRDVSAQDPGPRAGSLHPVSHGLPALSPWGNRRN